MKIDRLIGILSILLRQERVTAPYLAEKFEVSRRTINRDVEALCKAGIPLVTVQGKNGGISIMEGYRMDRTLLTAGEMESILTGLQGLDSVSGTNRYRQLMEKLVPGSRAVIDEGQHMLIDLSSYYKQSLAPKMELIRRAIDGCWEISFRYYSSKGEERRQIEPYLLVFQWSSWYVWGYCQKRRDYRLFKLNRMLGLELLDRQFVSRNPPPYEIQPERAFVPRMKVKALFQPAAKWRLIEEYGAESFEEQEDGQLLFSFGFADKDHVFGWLLTFGKQAELLEPVSLRDELRDMALQIAEIYQT